MANKQKPALYPFVDWFRSSSPYIHAHRAKTFVILFSGEALLDRRFANLVHDIALLHGLGIKVVLVNGARPQIEERLRLRGAEMHYINGLRVTDEAALTCVKEAAGAVRVEIEALLSMGVTNSPMSGAGIRVASGNFVTAQPIGVHDGVDYCHTGRVRRIDAEAIAKVVASGAIALIPPLGYSPTGEVFNLSAADVAGAIAVALQADKLIVLMEGRPLRDGKGKVLTNLVPAELAQFLKRRPRMAEERAQQLNSAIVACRQGVKRVHLLQRSMDGALLKELFTRDGVGTMLSAAHYETIRSATIGDVAGILELLEPLEHNGTLVRRARELLEMEIEHFAVVELDGMIIGCAALYCYKKARMAELACVAVHPSYRGSGRGDALLERMERLALQQAMNKLFVLTTQTAHWFRERGFVPTPVSSLPMSKRKLYNYQRNAKVFVKTLSGQYCP